ncbi:MAG: deoxyribose-phosphate aldolase [Deltaproteobacteria bacterium]|nr:deoxyribose-phosphate aldolase [Deltaproteobacteria bacterium]
MNMLAGFIDQTILRPDATAKELSAFVGLSKGLGFATLCVPPCHVALSSSLLGSSKTLVSTVIGFPLGFQSAGVKLLEAKAAVGSGASEIDMVINISMLKSGNASFVADEISGIVEAVPGSVVKVIIEACYLTDEEKIAALEAAITSGAQFVKTSTGFGPKGAEVRDVKLLAAAASGRIKVKASGGIKTLESALSMIAAGATRLGTSSGPSILNEMRGGFKR